MKITVDGKLADKRYVKVFLAPGYRKFPDNGQGVLTYELEIPKVEFIEIFEDVYNKARDDIKEDDTKMNEVSDFTASGYTSLDNMFDYKEDLSEIIELLNWDLLGMLFDANFLDGDFVINSDDEINVHDDKIIIRGRGYRF